MDKNNPLETNIERKDVRNNDNMINNSQSKIVEVNNLPQKSTKIFSFIKIISCIFFLGLVIFILMQFGEDPKTITTNLLSFANQAGADFKDTEGIVLTGIISAFLIFLGINTLIAGFLKFMQFAERTFHFVRINKSDWMLFISSIVYFILGIMFLFLPSVFY